MGAQPAERPSHNAALLIDFDNVTMGIRSNLGQELRKLLDSQLIKGKVAVQRAYADWRRYPQYIVSLSEASIDLIFAPAYGSSRKNATDIRLAIDALELVFTRPEIGTFILLSGDSDFSSLVLKLKEYGKYVIGVGLQESTSDILVQNCDEFYSYNTLGGLTSAADMPTERHDPWELVVKAIQRMVQRNDVMRSDRLKQVMLEIDASFDEKAAGFTKFNRFLAEAAHRDLIRLRKGESGQYEVALGTDSPVTEGSAPASEPVERPSRSRGGRKPRSKPAASQPRAEEAASKPRAEEAASKPRAKAALGSEAPADALKHAYAELTAVVDQLFDGSEPVRDSMVKRRLLERETSFDEGALGFRKFSEFLKQADADGIVDLNQGEDGNFYLKPPKPGRKKSGSDRGRGGRGRGEQTGGRGSSGARAASGQTSSATPGAEDTHGTTSAFAAAREAAKRTLGRFRGGSHGPAPTGGQKPGEKPPTGPVEESAKAETAGSGRTAKQPTSQKPRAERSSAQKTGADRSRGGKPRSDRSRTQKPRGQSGGQQPRSEQPRTQQAQTEKPKTQRSGSGASRSGRGRAQKPPVERKPASEAAVEQPAVEKPAAEKSVVEQTPAQQSPVVETPVAETPVVPAAKAPAPKRGMGRYRSGSRGAKTPTPGTPGPKIGKVEVAESPAPSPGTPTDSVETPTSPADKPEDSARAAASSESGAATKPLGGAASRPPGASGEAIEHMIRNYTGVGRRTAEALVDRFGEDVFQVIDREPGRLTEVLSAARARAVIAAREAEGSGSGA
jgi:uncharacterized protein (TIGR00288 family)